MSTCDIFSEHSGSKIVGGIIGSVGDLSFCLECTHDDVGSKCLFSVIGHLICNVNENSELDEDSLSFRQLTGFSFKPDCRTLLISLLPVQQPSFILSLDTCWPKTYRWQKYHQPQSRFGSLHQICHNFVVYRPLSHKVAGWSANLALVGHDAVMTSVHSLLKVGILENHQGQPPTTLKSNTESGPTCQSG